MADFRCDPVGEPVNGLGQLARSGHPRPLDKDGDHPDVSVVLERELDLPTQHVIGKVEAPASLLIDRIEPSGPNDDKHRAARSELALKRVAIVLARLDLDVLKDFLVAEAVLEVVQDPVD
jgi:hypothetical protein